MRESGETRREAVLLCSAMDPLERRWWLRAALVMLGLTLLPLVVAAVVAPAGHQFSGFVYEARDGVSYVAKATEGMEGQWLYHDPYTTEPQPPTLIYLPYLLLGRLDGPFRFPLAAVIQVARLGLAVALLWAVWRVAQAAWNQRGRRHLGFLLALLGGGVGALTGSHLDIFGYHYVSLDVAVSGAVGMEALNLAPHIVLTSLGCAWLALCWVRQEERPSAGNVLAAGLWTLAISTAYPQIAVLWAVIAVAAWTITRRRQMVPLGLAITVAAVPYAVYGLYLRQSNPVFRNWPPQSDIDIGDPLSFLVFGHLLMLPFVALALLALWRRRGAIDGRLGIIGICAVWLLAVTVLMYLPGLPTVMHRLYYASFIPFGILAADGLFTWARDRPRPSRRLLVYPAMFMCLAGAWSVGEGMAIPLLHRDDLALYFPTDEARVLRAVARDHPAGGRIVLSSFVTGLFVPGLSGQDTFVGFPFETLDLPVKNARVEQVYRATDPDELRRLVTATGASYLLWGRYEAGFGGRDPGALAGWTVLASSGGARIYVVPAR